MPGGRERRSSVRRPRRRPSAPCWPSGAGRRRGWSPRRAGGGGNERVLEIAVIQIAEGPRLLHPVQIVERYVFDHAQAVDQVFTLRRRPAAPKRAGGDRAQDEHDINESDGRPEEVVTVAGHELPDLVDERAEADSPDHGSPALQRGSQPDQHREKRRQHEKAAPEHVGDVIAIPSDLRIPRVAETGFGDGQTGRKMGPGLTSNLTSACLRRPGLVGAPADPWAAARATADRGSMD
jgi:hypothetical protein